jgi:hypothetical protein
VKIIMTIQKEEMDQEIMDLQMTMERAIIPSEGESEGDDNRDESGGEYGD